MRNQNPLAVLFFFSSRRRHTISLCDWSSDVCSSDLSITEVFQSATTAPAPNFWGCEVTNAAAGGSSKYVQLIQTDGNGRVIVTIQGFAGSTSINGTVVTLVPLKSPAGGGAPVPMVATDV